MPPTYHCGISLHSHLHSQPVNPGVEIPVRGYDKLPEPTRTPDVPNPAIIALDRLERVLSTAFTPDQQPMQDLATIRRELVAFHGQ